MVCAANRIAMGPLHVLLSQRDCSVSSGTFQPDGRRRNVTNAGCTRETGAAHAGCTLRPPLAGGKRRPRTRTGLRPLETGARPSPWSRNEDRIPRAERAERCACCRMTDRNRKEWNLRRRIARTLGRPCGSGLSPPMPRSHRSSLSDHQPGFRRGRVVAVVEALPGSAANASGTGSQPGAVGLRGGQVRISIDPGDENMVSFRSVCCVPPTRAVPARGSRNRLTGRYRNSRYRNPQDGRPNRLRSTWLLHSVRGIAGSRSARRRAGNLQIDTPSCAQ